MASIRCKFVSSMRHSQLVHPAILFSGAGVGLAATQYFSADMRVLCETQGQESGSTTRAFLNTADGQLIIERMVMEKIQMLCDAEKTRLHRWACDEADKSISANVPEAAKRAAKIVEQDADLSRGARKAADEVKKTVKEHNEMVWWNAQKWAEAETHQRMGEDFQKIISNDPKIQRIIGEHIANVRFALGQEVMRQVQEITEEDRLHKVNTAVLAVLQRKKDELLVGSEQNNIGLVQQTKYGTQVSLAKLEQVLESQVGRRTGRALTNARVGEVLGGMSFLVVAVLLGAPYCGLSIRR